jgi:hypothetical protein
MSNTEAGHPTGADASSAPTDPTWERERKALYEDALRGVDQRVREREEELASTPAGAPQPLSPARRVSGVCALVAAVATLVFGTVPPVVEGIVSDPPTFAAGAVGGDRPARLEDVLSALWQIRMAMNRYQSEHEGAVPERLSGLRDIPAVCPASGQPWIYTADGASYRIACPQPSTLDRGAVFLDDRVGPPQVSLRALGGVR